MHISQHQSGCRVFCTAREAQTTDPADRGLTGPKKENIFSHSLPPKTKCSHLLRSKVVNHLTRSACTRRRLPLTRMNQRLPTSPSLKFSHHSPIPPKPSQPGSPFSFTANRFAKSTIPSAHPLQNSRAPEQLSPDRLPVVHAVFRQGSYRTIPAGIQPLFLSQRLILLTLLFAQTITYTLPATLVFPSSPVPSFPPSPASRRLYLSVSFPPVPRPLTGSHKTCGRRPNGTIPSPP